MPYKSDLPQGALPLEHLKRGKELYNKIQYMEIKPTYVSFEQAKLLKEKGFNEKCVQGYNKSEKYLGELIVDFPNRNTDNIVISAPEQWQVIEWFRVKYGIWVVIIPELLNGVQVRYYPSIFEQGVGEDIEQYFNSPQEAYSAAFDYILKELI